MTQNVNSGRVLVGLVVVFAGVWLLLTNIGVTDWGTPWRWFPLILVLIGLWALVRSGFRDVVGPTVLIGVGVAVQLTVLPHDIPQAVRNAVWPAVLILAAGFSVVVLARGRRSSASDRMVVLFTLGYLVLLCLSPLQMTRYLLPVVVLACYLAGRAVASAAGRLPGGRR